ncbi:MAG: phage holin family protein [Armatimonadetes bacterium]|nr:phage holin family protein [Armatimonadota bacterium]
MARFLARWLFNAVAIYLTTLIIKGIQVPEPVAVNTIIAALILGIVNAFIRPIVLVLTLPANIVTLGLFTLVVNTVMLYLVAAVTPLQIATFWSAFIGALVIAVISILLGHIFRP